MPYLEPFAEVKRALFVVQILQLPGPQLLSDLGIGKGGEHCLLRKNKLSSENERRMFNRELLTNLLQNKLRLMVKTYTFGSMLDFTVCSSNTAKECRK
jgi:hypothetical protein